MTEALLFSTLAVALVALVLLVVLLKRAPGASEAALERQLGSLRGESAGLESRLREELGRNRSEASDTAQRQREEVGRQIEALRATVDGKLKEILASNVAELEKMRHTVDEKLQVTLNTRLTESFQRVQTLLSEVHSGLGQMQSLASGVGDLKRVLTNVKTRGTWGEVQLSNLLEQLLTPEQYASNVATIPGSAERVEFAIKLPGRERGEGQVWLPIDAKFPKEDYERLVDAAERANPEAVELAAKALEEQVRHEASEIQKKYVEPPHTTDFGILFLPTEGLYAEVLRRPGLAERLQRENRVMVAGPTTLAALLNSLQMGFRTLAIEKRSSEVWQVLGAVKTEFAKFGEVMDKVQKKLQEANNVIDSVKSRSNVIRKKLRDVEELPSAQAIALLGAADEPVDEAEPADGGGAES